MGVSDWPLRRKYTISVSMNIILHYHFDNFMLLTSLENK